MNHGIFLLNSFSFPSFQNENKKRISAINTKHLRICKDKSFIFNSSMIIYTLF